MHYFKTTVKQKYSLIYHRIAVKIFLLKKITEDFCSQKQMFKLMQYYSVVAFLCRLYQNHCHLFSTLLKLQVVFACETLPMNNLETVDVLFHKRWQDCCFINKNTSTHSATLTQLCNDETEVYTETFTSTTMNFNHITTDRRQSTKI